MTQPFGFHSATPVTKGLVTLPEAPKPVGSGFRAALDRVILQGRRLPRKLVRYSLVFDKPADLGAKGSEHGQQVVVRWVNTTAEKLHHSDHFSPEQDRKGKGAVQSSTGRQAAAL